MGTSMPLRADWLALTVINPCGPAGHLRSPERGVARRGVAGFCFLLRRRQKPRHRHKSC